MRDRWIWTFDVSELLRCLCSSFMLFIGISPVSCFEFFYLYHYIWAVYPRFNASHILSFIKLAYIITWVHPLGSADIMIADYLKSFFQTALLHPPQLWILHCAGYCPAQFYFIFYFDIVSAYDTLINSMNPNKRKASAAASPLAPHPPPLWPNTLAFSRLEL